MGYAFGPFFVDEQKRVIFNDGVAVEVAPKVVDLVICLIEAAGKMVRKDDLVDRVWGGASISDNNIGQHVRMARRALGDTDKPYEYIKTVHRLGYRFTASVQRVEERRPQHSLDETRRFVAAQLYANALHFAKLGTDAGLQSSEECCRRALGMDPRFADAYAQIAIATTLRACFGYAAPSASFTLAAKNAEESLRLNERCARGNIAQAALALVAEHDPGKALRLVEETAAMRPDAIELHVLRMLALAALGRHGQSVEAAREALTWHPGSTMVSAHAAFARYLAGEIEGALDLAEQILAFKPDAAFPTLICGYAALARGRPDIARASFETLLLGRTPLTQSYAKFRQPAIAGLAFIEGRAGNEQGAVELARDVERSAFPSGVALAIAAAGRGDAAAVGAALHRARVERDPWCPFARAILKNCERGDGISERASSILPA